MITEVSKILCSREPFCAMFYKLAHALHKKSSSTTAKIIIAEKLWQKYLAGMTNPFASSPYQVQSQQKFRKPSSQAQQ